MNIIKHRHRPLCVTCSTAPAELKPHGGGWKKRCSACQRNSELQADRERMARRKLARLEVQS
jgi:hypothetical protein